VHQSARAALRIVAAALTTIVSAEQTMQTDKFPCPEKLSYRVEWHAITAGMATVNMTQPKPDEWQTTMDLESAGMVSRLYHVLDKYNVLATVKFCAMSAELDAQEGKHNKYEKLTVDAVHHKVSYYEQDRVKKQDSRRELDAPPCTYEIVGALQELRGLDLPPGKSMTIPVTDGKKIASVRIDAQNKENINYQGKSVSTIRYEAFVFDNVLYKRKGRLLIWITDDAARLPVLLRMQMGFPIGTVNVELQKQERS
jgi:hypothetical protein